MKTPTMETWAIYINQAYHAQRSNRALPACACEGATVAAHQRRRKQAWRIMDRWLKNISSWRVFAANRKHGGAGARSAANASRRRGVINERRLVNINDGVLRASQRAA
jgi:hypothetical protein